MGSIRYSTCCREGRSPLSARTKRGRRGGRGGSAGSGRAARRGSARRAPRAGSRSGWPGPCPLAGDHEPAVARRPLVRADVEPDRLGEAEPGDEERGDERRVACRPGVAGGVVVDGGHLEQKRSDVVAWITLARPRMLRGGVMALIARPSTRSSVTRKSKNTFHSLHARRPGWWRAPRRGS